MQKNNKEFFLKNRNVICYLVGAGPGDMGLVTIKAKQLVQRADAIVYDKLIPPNILNLAKKNCRKIYVGKIGNKKSISQIKLNSVLIKECLTLSKKKKIVTVVRLKGGDPMLFGRAAEEMEALTLAGIPFEVVPGVSSAFAVPAYAGIPLTARGKSHSVSFVTGRLENKKEIKIINASDTVVYLMAVSNISEIVKKNLQAGKNSKTSVALIENGTLGKQKIVVGTLKNIEEKVATKKIAHPGLLVVGNVVNFSKTFSWYTQKPLFGKRIGLFRNKIETLEWSNVLEDAAATVVNFPFISSRKINSNINFLTKSLNEKWGNCIIFSSKIAVNAFFEALYKNKQDARALNGLQVVAVGKKTAELLRVYGIVCNITSNENGQEGLYQSVKKLNKIASEANSKKDSLKILYPRAKDVRQFLLLKLKECGMSVRNFILYENYIGKLKEQEKKLFFSLDAMVFASKKSVESFFINFSKELKNEIWLKKNSAFFPKFFFFDEVSKKEFLLLKNKYKLNDVIKYFKTEKATIENLKYCLEKFI